MVSSPSGQEKSLGRLVAGRGSFVVDEATNPCGGTELQDSLPRPLRLPETKENLIDRLQQAATIKQTKLSLWQRVSNRTGEVERAGVRIGRLQNRLL